MQPIAFLQNLNAPEIIMIFMVVLLFFGAKRLPELARSFGKSLREFKKATTDIEEDFRNAMEEEPEPVKSKKTPARTEAITEPKQVEPQAEAEPEAEPEAEESTSAAETEEKEPATKS